MNRAVILTEGTHDGVPVYYCIELDGVSIDIDPVVRMSNEVLGLGATGRFTADRIRQRVITKEDFDAARQRQGRFVIDPNQPKLELW